MKSAIETLRIGLVNLETQEREHLENDECVKAESCATDATAHRRAIFVLELAEAALISNQKEKATFYDPKAVSQLDTSISYCVEGIRHHSHSMWKTL